MNMQVSTLKNILVLASHLIGIPENKLLSSLGLNAGEFEDNNKHLDWKKGAKALSKVALLARDPKLGIRIGTLTMLQVSGNELSNLIVHSPDYLAAVRNFCEFSRIIGSMYHFTFTVKNDVCTIRFTHGIPEWKDEDLISYRLLTEISMTSMINLLKQLSQGRIRPLALEFDYTLDPEVRKGFKEMIDIPMLEDQKENALLLAKKELVLKNPNYSEVYYKMALAEATDRLKEVEQGQEIPELVRVEIRNILKDPNENLKASLEEVAARMNRSSRTLQRELKKEGMSFEQLKTEVSKEFVDRLLQSRKKITPGELADKIKLSLTAFREWYKRNYGREFT
ncbi:MAG TPA: AraC family transcriptional regulator ligand-binding domain-containing protein [Saprospiraceae bacterium]|nr:AraC family transcriptional regulator ligand-binding domain-containing protein [Saprospiraceae bacterium]HNT21624.1 AraC family transcriptional regulator ligand-binding domain-containing protein [Saprospiraceae bacterium]